MTVIGTTGKYICEHIIKKPIRYVANLPLMNSHTDMYAKSTKYVAGVAIFSIITKDVLNCYYYVKQSLNNKKIPEEKRGFVAALDFTNGGLMILAQLLMFFTISSKTLQKKWGKKLFDNFFDRVSRKDTLKLLHESPLFKNLKSENMKKVMNNIKDGCYEGLAVFTSLAAAEIVGKRIIVPLIATPLAGWFKEKYMEKPNPILQSQEKLELSSSKAIHIAGDSEICRLYAKIKNNNGLKVNS